MDSAIYDLGRAQFDHAIGVDEDRDEDGFIVLRPTASHVDARKAAVTTSIDDLESKLKAFREEKEALSAYQKTDRYKESKKDQKDKRQKKNRESLLNMMFNNADEVEREKEEEDENYKDLKKRKPRNTTLDTTYGKRFSPVVSLLHDTISDFDRIAAEIQEELNSPRGQARNMYRSTQIGNLISAKNSKLSAVKELGSIAKTVSDLEYKRDKDKKAVEGSDSTKAISSLGAKFLRGSFDLDEDRGAASSFDVATGGGKKGKKKKKKHKKDGNFERSGGSSNDGFDDDSSADEDEYSIQKVSKAEPTTKASSAQANSDAELAKAFADEIMGRKSEFSFTPYEKSIALEGKYTFVVACDPMDPEGTYTFLAVDPKTGKELKGFKSEHKDLYPKKKQVRLKFDLTKKQAQDLNSGRRYKLYFFDS